MENVKVTYGGFHKDKLSKHVYPTEWVIRTFLGKYPKLALNKGGYKGKKILDLGFGDCRNMPLLNNCEFDIYGVEITDEILAMARIKLEALGISASLHVGTNVSVPFETDFFDYLLACHSCYYVDEGTSFNDNLKEMARVLKPGGVFVASLPSPGNFILKDATRQDDGHVIITSDVFNLRNGYVFRNFETEEEVVNVFSKYFENIAVTKCEDDFWGLQINYFLIAGTKR